MTSQMASVKCQVDIGAISPLLAVFPIPEYPERGPSISRG
jgi:hypothetical protein